VLSIEPQVFDLLVFLVGNRDRVVSKNDLLASVWGGRIVSESTLFSRINAARHAIGDSGDRQRLIRTTIGKGIRFIGAVRQQAGAEPVTPTAAVDCRTAVCQPLERPGSGISRRRDLRRPDHRPLADPGQLCDRPQYCLYLQGPIRGR